MVQLDRRRNCLFFVPAEVYPYLKLFPRYGVLKNSVVRMQRQAVKKIVYKCIINILARQPAVYREFVV